MFSNRHFGGTEKYRIQYVLLAVVAETDGHVASKFLVANVTRSYWHGITMEEREKESVRITTLVK